LPGIFSRVGEYAVVIKDDETGVLIDPGASEAWEDAIVEMAASTALREKLTLGAREQTRQRYLLGDKVSSWFTALQSA
jgi:glycosyltransferase involved in cell wall biosynthesis